MFITLLVILLKNLSSYSDIKEKYENSIYYLNNLSYYKKHLADLEKEIQNTPKKVSSDLTPILLLNTCSKIAELFNITLLSYNPVNRIKKNKNDIDEISIELNIKTDYLKALKFINKIENMGIINRIDILEIYRMEPYSQEVKCKIIITGFSSHENK